MGGRAEALMGAPRVAAGGSAGMTGLLRKPKSVEAVLRLHQIP